MSVDDEVVLLDLLNTTPIVDGAALDLLDGAWLRAHDAAGCRLADVRRLRDDLQGVTRGGPAAVLDSYVANVVSVPSISDEGVRWRLDADWAARVVLAWGQVQADMPGRLRPCANGDCHLFLLDRSRAGTARWCSMSGCGNRMKARRHYGRSKA